MSEVNLVEEASPSNSTRSTNKAAWDRHAVLQPEHLIYREYKGGM